MAEIEPLEVDDAIYFYPGSAPGCVTEITGDNDYTVQVQDPNDSYHFEYNVGQRIEGYTDERYLTPRKGGICGSLDELGEA